MKHTKEDILALDPCNDGLRFVEQYGFDAVQIYNNCPRGDWLIWWLRRTKAINKVQAVTLAIACAERVLTIYEQTKPGNTRPRQAIEAAKTWIENPTEENQQAANAAAVDAADYAANYDAAYAAAYTAYAAAADAGADAAAAVIDYAANAVNNAAAYAAVDAATVDYADAVNAAADASKKEHQWQADKIREIIPCPFDTDYPDHSVCQPMAQFIG